MTNKNRCRAARIAGFLATFAVPCVFASAPACYTYNGQGYCQYNGKVAKAYMNAYNEILLYFDAPANPADVASVGITWVSNYSAARFLITSNPEFGKALMAALLSAQARRNDSGAIVGHRRRLHDHRPFWVNE